MIEEKAFYCEQDFGLDSKGNQTPLDEYIWFVF